VTGAARGPSRWQADRAAIALAVAAATGAWWSGPVPVGAGLAAVGVTLLVRRPWLAVPAVLLLAAGLGHRAWQDVDDPGPRRFEGEVTITRDPRDVDGALTLEVKAGSRRMEAWARGRAASSLRDRLAGERVAVIARVQPLGDKPWLTRRHVVGRMVIEVVHGHTEGALPTRAANAFRRLLGRGAASMPQVPRSLFGGFVLGDVREQPLETADDFRASGLTHLLAVSGQNVAFVLAAVSPVVARLRPGGRWATTVGVLAFFALVTRFEPSVLRATAMAGLATSASVLGRRSTSIRLLALAVAGLVLVDPFLVGSVAFGLSVAASAGIILLARPLAERIPGPPALVRPLAVTLAAQAGVAPVLIPVFGGLPVASIPANVLVEPVAGFVMTWGLTAGAIAGALGGPLAEVLHVPTRAALWWVASVARWGADLPLGELGPAGAGLATVAGAAFVAARRRQRPLLAAVAAMACVGVLAAPGWQLRSRPRHPVALDHVGEAWFGTTSRGDDVTIVVLDTDVHARRMLEPVRRAGVRRIDLVVCPDGSARTGRALSVLRRRVPVTVVWAPPDHRVARAETPITGEHVVGDLVLAVRAVEPALEVEIRRYPA
jgi:competence protein ComEC